MYNKTVSDKNSKGIFSLESDDGRLRVRFRANSQRKSFALGLADTSENRAKGESIIRQMQLDMLSGNFDSTLGKYKPLNHLTVVESIKPKQAIDLSELWEKYVDYKKPKVSITTYNIDYRKYRNHIAKLPTKSLDDAIEIRDFLVSNLSINAAKRVITNISACCSWGIDSGLIKINPFTDMAEKIKLSRSNSDKKQIETFTKKERDIIIEAFENSKLYAYYTPYVRFLFFTGCRPSEAIGLQWKHINDKLINFEQAAVTNGKNIVIKKGLKTQKTRKFPLNHQVREILNSLKLENINPEEYVFKSKNGKFIDTGDFLNHAWKGYKNRHGKLIEGIVTQLVREGKVDKYHEPYHTRHTFVTLCVDNGVDAKDIARWVGNSPKIIYEHYAGNKRDLQVPEL